MRVYPMPEKSVWHHILRYLRQYCTISNIHGVHYLSSNRSKTEKFVWAFSLIISFCCCIFMIYKILQKYRNSPIVISFSTKDNAIYDVPFPAVTICSESKCRSSDKLNYSAIYYKIRDNESVSDEERRKFSYLYMLCDTDDTLDMTGNLTVDQDFFAVVNEMKPKFTAACIFLENDCQTFLVPIVTKEGICYSFNIMGPNDIFREDTIFYHQFSIDSNSSDFSVDAGYSSDVDINAYPIRSLVTGVDHSLTLLIFNFEDTDVVCDTYNEGHRVLIHSPADIPRLSKHYFHVSFNKRTMVAVQPDLIITSEEVTRMSPQIRKCYLSNERPLKYFRFYTQSNCFIECLTNYTLKECGCVMYYMPRSNGTKLCGIGSKICVLTAEVNMINEDLDNIFLNEGKTQCDCQPSCNDWQYTVETSQSDINFQKYFLNKDKKFHEDDENYTASVISIYFKKEQFMSLERKELYGVFDLISNFGGLLGLFIGFSLISFVEIIYFLTLRILFNSRLNGHWSSSE